MTTATMTIAEFCHEMRIGKTTFFKMKKLGDVPPTFTYGGQVRILRAEFEVWLRERGRAA